MRYSKLVVAEIKRKSKGEKKSPWEDIEDKTSQPVIGLLT